MQFIGYKLKNLTKARGLMVKSLAEAIDVEPHHFSKMLRLKMSFDQKKVSKASAFLGISEAYLRDEARPFNPGDKIPEDVLIERKPTPITTTTPSDLTKMARIFERQAADIENSKKKIMETEFNAMKEMQRQMAEILQEVSGNTRVMSANVLALAEIVKELREERGGEHDTD